jgi:hypothetical protein
MHEKARENQTRQCKGCSGVGYSGTDIAFDCDNTTLGVGEIFRIKASTSASIRPLQLRSTLGQFVANLTYYTREIELTHYV